jgi:hypothetical protein
MATEISQNDMQSFYEFLGRRLQDGAGGLTPEESVREFRAYQTELARFKQETQLALEQSARGESKPLDLDALMRRVRARLANDGIAD